MSRHDEFQDLKEQLRQQRPTTEPLPPAFKRRLRAQLVEKNMKQTTSFVFSPLRLAFGALLVLLIPVMFWLWQGGLLGDGLNPAVSAPVELEPAATALEEPQEVVPAADKVEVVSSFPQPGAVLSSERPTVSVMVSYELHSANEAELILRLNQSVDEESGRGVASASQVITQSQGVAVLPLTLENAELNAGEVSLNVLLQDTSGESEQLLFLDFPADFQWTFDPDDSSTPQPEAEILGWGQPQPSEDGWLVPGLSNYGVEVYVAYELGTYAQGYASLGYEYEDLRGSSSGGTTQWVSGEASFTTFYLSLEPEFFFEDGSFRDEVVFNLELGGMDETRQENVIIYPEEAVQAQLALPEYLDIRSVVLAEDALGQPVMEVELWYERRLASSSLISLTVEAWPEVLASITIPVNRQRDSVKAVLPVDLAAYPGDYLLRIAASLDTGAETLLAEFPLQVGSLLTERVNEVWLVSMDWISTTAPVGDLSYLMSLVAGYALSDEYQYGVLTVTAEQQATSSGGGSGGGSTIIEPGTGAFNFDFPVAKSFAPGSEQQWPEGFRLTIEMRGVTADGTESVLSVWKRPE